MRAQGLLQSSDPQVVEATSAEHGAHGGFQFFGAPAIRPPQPGDVLRKR